MKRNDFQTLAVLRLKEAKILLRAGCPDGAYYLAGYAAECALKACIAKQTERFEFPDLQRTKDSWTHALNQLVSPAGLTKEREAMEWQQPEFFKNWKIVREWNEQSRYQRRSLPDAEALLRALEDRKYGVLKWLKRHW